MGWLNNIINKTKEKVTNAVNGAVQNVTSGVQNAVQAGQQVINGMAQQGQQMVQNTVQNVSQGVTDQVNGINNQIQGTPQGVTTPQSPVATAPLTQGSQASAPTTTPTTTPQQNQTPTNTPTTTPTTTPEQSNTTPGAEGSESSFDTSEPILTYEDYLKQQETGLGYIKDETTQLLDKQSTETLKHIDEQLESDKAYAEGVKDTTETSLQKEKDEVYAYVDKMLGDTLAYNNEAYGKLIENITGLMEQGKIQAGEAKELLMQIAEETKNATYGAAERQREEAERQADINRQRAITDANSAYEQNKASYGAKAEALGDMGLTGGGYGDWLNASAYAQNRSEVQGARAQSDTAKREAKYTEDMTKLAADQKYSDQKYQAESEYLTKMGEIDTTYLTNLGEAEQWKLGADKDARDAADATKRQADSDYNAGKLQSDVTYGEMIHGYEKQASEDKLKVNQETEAKKLKAEIDYVEGILGNSKALAEFKESLKAGDAAAEEKRLAVYEQLLKGVNDGTYTAEDAAALADAFGLGDDWKKAIAGAAGRKEETDAGIKAEQDQQQRVQNFDALLERGKTGALTAEEITTMAAELGFDINNPDDKKLIDLAVAAANNYKTASDEEKQYQKSSNALVILEGAKKGTYTAEEIPQIAAMLGLDAEKDSAIIQMLTDAASDYATGVTKTEDQQKTNAFLSLLGSANSGELTTEELKYLAGKMGLSTDDIRLLEAAAGRYTSGTEEELKQQKTMNFISLLDGANTGAYKADEIEKMATMLGLKPAEGEKGTEGYKANDQELIDMLKSAATDYANGEAGKTAKEDMQYQNKIYAELLSAANNGDYTEAQIKALAKRFGIEDKDNVLADAARLAQEGKTKTESQNSALSIIDLKDKGYITGETSDDEIQDYIDAGLIAEGDLTKVKEERNKMALDKVTGLIDTGDYAYAAEKTDEYLERGFISPEESKKAYFDITKKECEDGFATTEEIDGAIAEINNRLAQGKLTEKDAEALKQYAYANTGETMNLHLSNYEIDGKWQLSFGIGNTSFVMWSKDFADIEKPSAYTLNIINSVASGNGDTNSVMIDGILYVRFNSKENSWRAIPKDANSQALYNAYSQYSGNHTKPSAPKHSN